MIDLTAYSEGLAAGIAFMDGETDEIPENPYTDCYSQAWKDWYDGFNAAF